MKTRCDQASKSGGGPPPAVAAMSAASSASMTPAMPHHMMPGARRPRRACRPPREWGTGRAMSSKEDLYDVAIDLFGEGKLEEAVAKYKEAIALDPGFADAWHGLAMAYNELGQHQGAIEAGKKL